MKILLIVVAISFVFASSVLGQNESSTEIPSENDPIWDEPFDPIPSGIEDETLKPEDIIIPAEKNESGVLYGKVVNNWLKIKSNLRLATSEEYESAGVNLIGGRNITAIGDFNGDKIEDFAVILVSKNQKKSFSFAIFNGPLDLNRKLKPSFYMENIGEYTTIEHIDGELSLVDFGGDMVRDVKQVGGSYKVDKTKTERCRFCD